MSRKLAIPVRRPGRSGCHALSTFAVVKTLGFTLGQVAPSVAWPSSVAIVVLGAVVLGAVVLGAVVLGAAVLANLVVRWAE